jgi:hypothetical protein
MPASVDRLAMIDETMGLLETNDPQLTTAVREKH